MMEDGAGCYDVVSGLLLRATLTGCCGSHIRYNPSVHFRRNKPTQGRRLLSLTQDSLDRYIPNGLGLTSGMKVRRRELLLCHSVFHLVSAQHATLLFDLKRSFKNSSAAGTNGCLDLICRCPL